MPKQTTDDNPPTVGFNLKEMRDTATQALMDSIRHWAKQMDEIDVLDRVFNERHQAAVAGLGERVGAPESRSNGHTTLIDANPASINTSASVNYPKRGSQRPTREASAALVAALAAELLQHPNGLRVGQLTTSVDAKGLVHSVTRTAAEVKVRYRLQRMVAERLAVARTLPDKSTVYYPAPRPAAEPERPKRSISKAGLKAMRANAAAMRVRAAQRAAKKRAVNKGSSLPPIGELVAGALLKLGKGTPMDLTNYLISQGVPRKLGKHELNLHVNWALRNMRDRNSVIKLANKEHPRWSMYALAEKTKELEAEPESGE